MRDLKFFQEIQIFILKFLLFMMLFLIQNVIVYRDDLRMTV